MKKYIIWIDSLIKTFLIVESGKDISYNYQQKDNADMFDNLNPGDVILGYYAEPIEKVSAMFIVKDKISKNSLVLSKVFETSEGAIIEDSVWVSTLEEKGIMEISEAQYEMFIAVMMKHIDEADDIKKMSCALESCAQISESDFREWLSTQIKKNGDGLSNEYQNAYYYMLKSIPSMLGAKDVFSIKDVDAFDSYRTELEASAEYGEANPNIGAGTLSAALTKYRKYLSERKSGLLSTEELISVLKKWCDNKYVKGNITSTLVAFGFKYAPSIKATNKSSENLLTLAGVEEKMTTIHALIDRGVDLHFAVKEEELGMAFVEEKSFIDAVKYEKPFLTEYERNRIVFGAPGTGKSFTLNKEKDALIANGGSFERVTFHPDYSYANFVGTYKPVPVNGEITYSFVAGPFIRTWIEAIKSAQSDDPKPYVLLIEEINRANVAAVFGDVFQLLDRDENGISEYPIQTSKELREYLARELKCCPDEVATIRIPSNMFIWATMNSADQGVFPMDTAFKRRWDFRYIGIDESQDGIKGYTLEIAGQKINWNALRTAINARLTSLNINEDKLIGPYFINEKTLKDNKAFVEAFKSKVIMYLFEDAAKQRRGKVFYQDGVKYSDLCQKFMSEGVKVFNPEICKNLIDTEEA